MKYQGWEIFCKISSFFFRILKLLNQRKLETLKERWWNQNPQKKVSLLSRVRDKMDQLKKKSGGGKILNFDVHVLRRVRRPTTTVGGSPSTTLAASSSSSSSGSVSPSSLLQLNTGQSHFLHFFLSPFPGDLIGSFPMVCGSYLFCPGTTSIKPHQRELALSR